MKRPTTIESTLLSPPLHLEVPSALSLPVHLLNKQSSSVDLLMSLTILPVLMLYSASSLISQSLQLRRRIGEEEEGEERES